MEYIITEASMLSLYISYIYDIYVSAMKEITRGHYVMQHIASSHFGGINI